MQNPVVWFEVLGQDADKLRSFYGELLGWEFDTDNPVNYGVVAAGRGGIPGGVGEALEGPGWATFYTRVPDLEASVRTAERLGSRVLMPATDLPDMRIAVVSDPEGHPVGLCADPKRVGP
jgi:predicted enzyme related to lactoylglutathione lyase